MALMPWRADEVEEEGSPEDESREDTGEDVVGRDTDVVLVVDVSSAIERSDTSCEVDVVCRRPTSAPLAFDLCPESRIPSIAAALNDADATQNFTAHG